MKSFFTSSIAICLFVLCLLEKEAKQQAIEAERLQKEIAVNQNVNNASTTKHVFVKSQKTDLLPVHFQLAAFAVSDSTANSMSASNSL